MATDYTVGDLVAEFLSACGVTTVFGIASVHNIPMLDGIGCGCQGGGTQSSFALGHQLSSQGEGRRQAG